MGSKLIHALTVNFLMFEDDAYYLPFLYFIPKELFTGRFSVTFSSTADWSSKRHHDTKDDWWLCRDSDLDFRIILHELGDSEFFTSQFIINHFWMKRTLWEAQRTSLQHINIIFFHIGPVPLDIFCTPYITSWPRSASYVAADLYQKCYPRTPADVTKSLSLSPYHGSCFLIEGNIAKLRAILNKNSR